MGVAVTLPFATMQTALILQRRYTAPRWLRKPVDSFCCVLPTGASSKRERVRGPLIP